MCHVASFVAQAPVPIAMFDRQMCYLAASPRWVDQFYGGADPVGRCHSTSSTCRRAGGRGHRAGSPAGSARRRGDRLRGPDGTGSGCALERCSAWHTPDAAVGGITIFVEDLTERRARPNEGARPASGGTGVSSSCRRTPILVHRDQRFTLANPAAARVLGAPSRSARGTLGLGLHRSPRRAAGDGAGFRAARPREAQGPDGIRPSGSTACPGVEVSSLGFVDAEGAAIQVIMRDVTAHRRAERAAEAGEERLAAVLEAALDGIVTVDEDMRVVLVNPSAERIFGAEPGTLNGRLLDELVPRPFRQHHANSVRAFGASGETHRRMGAGIVYGRRINGEIFPVEASISRLEVGGKRLYTAICRDVSERERTLARLEEERARFRQLAEAIREVFWLSDVDKSEIIYVSPAYEAIWGRSCDSLYASARNWMEAIHREDRERVARAAQAQAEGSYDLVYRILRPDGAVRWIHDRAFPVCDADGRVVRIAGVAEDVTDQRRFEEQLRQTQKMESVGRLAGGVAHDFNNLLTVIVSAAELLAAEEGQPAATVELVQDILDAGRRGAALTRQLLAFSRQEVVEPRVMDLADVVGDAEKLLRRLIGEDVALETHHAGSCPVRIDPGQWSQVLMNLAVNARDAMPHGGTLTIATRVERTDRAFLRTHPNVVPGRYAVLSVADTGSGMTPETCARVFEPFFTTKGERKGTGLGLAVVHGVVQQAGGLVDVTSAPGEGTRFDLYLPLAADPVELRVPTAEPTNVHGHETVLLVEDEPVVRRMTARILRRSGYVVLTAADAAEALRVLDAHDGEIQLLLTDVVMPHLAGPALARAVRERNDTVKVLYASGYMDEDLRDRFGRGERAAFLQKPYSPAVLLRRVREVLDAPPGGSA
ncbi:MAG: PAS domain S-box protein [Myxococcota bacterium]